MCSLNDTRRLSRFIAGALFAVLVQGCAGPTGDKGTAGVSGVDGVTGVDGDDGTNGDDGANGVDGTDGTNGINGTNGTNGTNGATCNVVDNGNDTSTITCSDGSKVVVKTGEDAGDFQIGNFHGTEYLETTGEFGPPSLTAVNGKRYVDITIDSASAGVTGVVTVNFTVKTKEGLPFTTLTSVSSNIAKLAPAGGGSTSNNWVAYLYGNKTTANVGKGPSEWNSPPWSTPATAYVYVASSESSGTGLTNGRLTNNGAGTYTYAFKKRIDNITVDGAAITYDRTLTHRVSIMTGGHAGATGTDTFDFRPDGNPVTERRDIVQTETCKECHGNEFHGHGGNRITAENCMTCHNAGITSNVNIDAQGRESMDMKVMIHKIHAGGEVASIPGADGIVWNDPGTLADESADNGKYVFWGNSFSRHDWYKVGFPAVIENCTKCHQGTGAQVDNWKTKPSRAACGSCHDKTDFGPATVNHVGGPQADDSSCSGCHTNGTQNSAFVKGISVSHDFTTTDSAAAGYDPRNITEFLVSLTVSTPANGSYFVAGESPVATLVLTDRVTGLPIDHTTVVEDPTAEGCLVSGCPAKDGKFKTAALYVHGPRALRNPAITTGARAAIFSSSTGPFNLNTLNSSLILKVDGGLTISRDSDEYGSGGYADVWLGTITVPVSSGTFADKASATTAEIVTWLNADAKFAARAIAYDQAGKVGIRSRNLGRVFSTQLLASDVATKVFGGDLAVKLPPSSNNVSSRTVPANNDPKAVRSAGQITYTMDPVDDLEAGTYIVSVEITDRGNNSDTDYQTPSTAKTPFQVKTGTAEKQVAGNCGSACHQGPDGKGFVLDWRRHNKVFDDTAIDQCGACHDNQPGSVVGAAWSGTKQIAKRVHAVHYGSGLTDPLTTVDYQNGDPIKGRNWDITFPQDVRNCETCHANTAPNVTSGTWQSKPAREPCMGCHDNGAAKAHMIIMTYDPTPLDAWSGDEEETCKACH